MALIGLNTCKSLNNWLCAEEDMAQLVAELNVSERLSCSFCDASFLDQAQQRQHYKLDWHRYNLKQHLAHKKLVSEERFTQITGESSPK